MIAWLVALPALADPIDDGEDIDVPTTVAPSSGGNGFERPSASLDTDDDDAGMTDFVAAERKKAPPTVWWHVDPSGKKPLTDAFDIQITAWNDQLVLAELPVLVATGRDAFVAEHPGGMVVIAEVTSGAFHQTLTQLVTASTVFESGPTLIFFKVAMPNPAKSGDLRFLIKVGELPTPPPEPDPDAPKTSKPPPPPPPPPPPTDKFARTTVYLRK
ncbi:MAG: hypothetical protein KC621_07720 [Myxococcales bacterium]|nr:hypothetical protein [Myxococcales bacterium]